MSLLLQASAADAADGTTRTTNANTKPAQYSGMGEAQCRALLEQFKAVSVLPFPLKVYGSLQGKPAPAPPAATTATASSSGATLSNSAAADSTGSTAGGAAGSGLAAATATAAAAAGGAGAAAGDSGSKRIGAQKTAVPEALMSALLQHVHHSTSNKPQVCLQFNLAVYTTRLYLTKLIQRAA
jgi:hypothetical protein